MKNRIKQRANRKMKEMEERLDKRNHYGNKDLTAYNAVQQIRTKGKAEIALKQSPLMNHRSVLCRPVVSVCSVYY